MSNVFSDLATNLTKMVKDSVSIRAMKKEDLQTLLSQNIESHKKMEYILGTQSDESMKRWMRDMVQPALKTNNSDAKNVYGNYQRELRGKAAADERSRPLGSLMEANSDYADILEEISKKLDKFLDRESVDIYNVRMSHIAILGLIRQSNMVLNFTIYLYSYLTRVYSRSATSIPRYREAFMLKHQIEVARAVSDVRDKKGAYTFLREVDMIRQRQNDAILGATGKFNFDSYLTTAGFSISFLDNIMSALSCLNVFSAAMDAWDDYKLDRYERDKEVKEWLEQHVALLQMDLQDTDKTSPEYTRLVNIIKAYDDKIADYDQRIRKFENEE